MKITVNKIEKWKLPDDFVNNDKNKESFFEFILINDLKKIIDFIINESDNKTDGKIFKEKIFTIIV
jgi:hypothetical protein